MSTLKLLNHETAVELLFCIMCVMCVMSIISLQLLPSTDKGLETIGNHFRLTASTSRSNILARVLVFLVLASLVYLFFGMSGNFSKAKEQ